MFAYRPLRGPHPRTATRQAAARLRRLAAALATLTCALLASAAIVPAAWAVNVIPPGGEDPVTPVPGVVTAGGMAGWQITVIALGAHHVTRPPGHEDNSRAWIPIPAPGAAPAGQPTAAPAQPPLTRGPGARPGPSRQPGRPRSTPGRRLPAATGWPEHERSRWLRAGRPTGEPDAGSAPGQDQEQAVVTNQSLTDDASRRPR